MQWFEEVENVKSFRHTGLTDAGHISIRKA